MDSGINQIVLLSPTKLETNILSHTVCLEPGGFTVPAASLVYGLDKEDVSGATLKPVHCVVVLFDVGDNHPAIHGVVQACSTGRECGEIYYYGDEGQDKLQTKQAGYSGVHGLCILQTNILPRS